MIHLPERHLEDLRKLILEMSDYQPAKIDYPEYIASELDAINVYQMKSDSTGLEHLAHVSLNEPNLTVRWVKMEVDEGWKHIIESCRELHEAGYPGCIGCGGPNSELPWMNLEIESGTLSKTYTFTCFFDTDTKVSVPIVCK